MISIFDLFSMGLGPSSSHTVAPMRAAHAFVQQLEREKQIENTETIIITTFGSLAYTGRGHATDKATLLGLEGHLPETINPALLDTRIKEICTHQCLQLNNRKKITFDIDKHYIENTKDQNPHHTNSLYFQALDADGQTLKEDLYYSIGAGFIAQKDAFEQKDKPQKTNQPFPFDTAKMLFQHCRDNNMSIAQIMLENEKAYRTQADIVQKILHIIDIMRESIAHGCHNEGILPGGLNIQRRAPELLKKLTLAGKPTSYKHIDSLEWLAMFAIAVGEENAANHRIVTAPTNGAAGILPAVIHFYETFYPGVCESDLVNFFLTAGAIALLYKKGASLSGAEVGCQGEIGVATSMAAGAFASSLGATLPQIESAAEIAMEHSLGLTCDPIAGLVQIPCIERNAIGAVKAVNIARFALLEAGNHKKISLDKVIKTMLQTGQDMHERYKETAQGGLAHVCVNIAAC
jgi:L-serine dehydratase